MDTDAKRRSAQPQTRWQFLYALAPPVSIASLAVAGLQLTAGHIALDSIPVSILGVG